MALDGFASINFAPPQDGDDWRECHLCGGKVYEGEGVTCHAAEPHVLCGECGICCEDPAPTSGL